MPGCNEMPPPAVGSRTTVRGPRRIPVVLWIVWVIYGLSASGRVGNQDAEVTMSMARALMGGGVTLPEGMANGTRGVGGSWTSPYGVGHSLYLMPYVAMARGVAKLAPALPVVMWEEFLVSFANVPVIGALLAYLVAAWRRAGASEARVTLGVLVFGLCTMLWPYAKLPFSDSLLALTTFAGWYHWTQGEGRRSALLAGGWLGMALLSRRQADAVVPILLCLAVVDGWRKASWGRFGWLIGMLLPAVLLRLLFNQARFGNPFLERHPGMLGIGEVLRSDPASQFLEVLLSATYGLLPYNLLPLAFLILGMAGLWKHQRPTAWVVLTLMGGGIGFLSFMRFGSGVSFGSRYLLYLVGFMALAWPWVPRPMPVWIRLALVPAVGASLWWMAGGAALDPVPVMYRVAGLKPPFLQSKGLYQEWGRVLSIRDRSGPAALEANPIWRHDAFRRPDFWWCHLAARWGKGGLVGVPQRHPPRVPTGTEPYTSESPVR